MLTDRQKQILSFCATGRKSREIAKYFNLGQDSIYGELRLLQRLNLLQKSAAHRGASANFFTIGAEPQLDGQYERKSKLDAHCEHEYNADLVNVDFVKHSHNIWGAAA